MAEPAEKNARSGARCAARSWLASWLPWGFWTALAVSAAQFAVPLAAAGAAEAAPSVLLVVPDAESSSPMRRLQRVLVSRLSEIGVAVHFSARPFEPPQDPDSAPSPQDVLAFIWLDTQPESIAVHFYEAAGTHLRERRIPVAGINSASIEEVAIVVRSAVSALLDRSKRSAANPTVNPQGAIGPDAGKPFAPGSTVVQDDGSARHFADRSQGRKLVRLSVGYVGHDYAPQLRWNHGIALGLAWQGWANGLSLGLSYSWVAPISLRTEQLEVTLLRHPSELILGWEVPLWEPWLKFRPEGAFGADAVFRKTRGMSDDIEVTANQRRWSWSVSGRLALVLVPLPGWQGFVAVGADYLLNRFTYDVAGEGGGALIEPRRWRPVLHGGMAFELP